MESTQTDDVKATAAAQQEAEKKLYLDDVTG
jgi:hypothetical protein